VFLVQLFIIHSSRLKTWLSFEFHAWPAYRNLFFKAFMQSGDTWPEQRETSRLQQHLSYWGCALSGDLGILGGANPD
jgi:hypothetical protein